MQDEYLVPDAVVEIEPTYPKGGKIVWEWHVWDHLVQNTDRTKANYGNPAAHPELVDVACNGRTTPAFWNHMNSINYNPALDQIVHRVRGCKRDLDPRPQHDGKGAVRNPVGVAQGAVNVVGQALAAARSVATAAG